MSKSDDSKPLPEKQVSHTPGPWCAVKSRGLNAFEVRAVGGAYLADVWGADTPVPSGVQKGEVAANANLIAAAPDLLKALQFVLMWSRPLPDADDPSQATYYAALSVANDAIAKALGKAV